MTQSHCCANGRGPGCPVTTRSLYTDSKCTHVADLHASRTSDVLYTHNSQQECAMFADLKPDASRHKLCYYNYEPGCEKGIRTGDSISCTYGHGKGSAVSPTDNWATLLKNCDRPDGQQVKCASDENLCVNDTICMRDLSCKGGVLSGEARTGTCRYPV